MRSLGALLRHPFAGAAVRYGVAGATVASVYLSIPLLLNGVLGVPIQVAIPVAYLIAVTLHFNLQRHFVFAHVVRFALPMRRQIGRYLAIGAVQYPTTALAIAFLPRLLGVSERVMFVIITLIISATFFFVLRGHVFHPVEEEELSAESAPQPLRISDAASASREQSDPVRWMTVLGAQAATLRAQTPPRDSNGSS